MIYGNGISCVVVSYRSLENLKKCIESLQKQKDILMEIIVVDNDSRDGSAEYLSGLDVKSILLKRNCGFGAAVNIGVGKSEYKYIFILNPDTEVPEHSLSRLFQFAESKGDFGLIAPVLEYIDGRSQLSARSLPRRRDFLVSRGSPLSRFGILQEKRAGYIMPGNESPVEIPAVSATAILIKKTVFEEIGKFDERFFMYMEDIDLCRRLAEKRLPAILLPAVRIRHSWRSSSSKRPYFASFHHHLSVLKYFKKYDKDLPVLNFILSVFLAAGFIFSVIIIFGKRIFGR